MRGFFGIGVESGDKSGNLGNLMRTAHGIGASFLVTVGRDCNEGRHLLGRQWSGDGLLDQRTFAAIACPCVSRIAWEWVTGTPNQQGISYSVA